MRRVWPRVRLWAEEFLPCVSDVAGDKCHIDLELRLLQYVFLLALSFWTQEMCSTTWRQRLVHVAGYGEAVLIVHVTKKFGSRTKKSEHALNRMECAYCRRSLTF